MIKRSRNRNYKYLHDISYGDRHGYQRAVDAIKALPFRIENADQVKNVSGIGNVIRGNIQEIINTGKLNKVEATLVLLLLVIVH